MPASTMTMPEARKAVELYRSGLSQPQVAQALGRSRKAIRSAMRQLGVAPRNLSQAYLARKQAQEVA